MAPLLIDGRDLLKLGIISVLVTVLVFSAGFLFGHHKAEAFYQTASETRSLLLPEAEVDVEASVSSRAPETIEAGEEIDVDQPASRPKTQSATQPETQPETLKQKVSKQAGTGTKKSKTDSAAEVVASAGKKSASSNTPVAVKKAIAKPAVASASRITETVLPQVDTGGEISDSSNSDMHSVVSESVSPAEASIVNAFSQDEINKIKFSIQVGMYVRLVNAENMMKLLQAQQYDAYVTDYTNKNDEIRYNVRFGYFSDKKSALAKLSEFKDSEKGDGYLVKFSADNIVKTANATAVKQLPDAPASIDEPDTEILPAPVPDVIMQDKISQADVVTPVVALNN